jgi:hypothetical protein
MTTSKPPSGRTHDADGQVVVTGDTVEVLAIKDSVLARLEGEDRKRVESMKGKLFAVYEIDEWGGAWVRLSWKLSGGRRMSHALSLAPQQMRKRSVAKT